LRLSLDSYAYTTHSCANRLGAGKVILANRIPEEALAAIEAVVRGRSDGVSAPEILRALATPPPPRTLQYRLKHLVTRNRLIMEGEGRWARYRTSNAAAGRSIDWTAQHKADESGTPLSAAGISIRDYVRQAPEARKPVGYDRKFLDRYRPNVSFYLTEQDRVRLTAAGRPLHRCSPIPRRTRPFSTSLS
jgi:hypothetical protein